MDRCTGRAGRRHWGGGAEGVGNNTWAIKGSALLIFPISLLIKYKDNPQTSTQGRRISLGTNSYQQCFATTQPSLEPLLGTRTSAKTFQLGSLQGPFSPCTFSPGGPRSVPPSSLSSTPRTPASFSLQSPVAGSTLTALSLPTLIDLDNPSLLPR